MLDLIAGEFNSNLKFIYCMLGSLFYSKATRNLVPDGPLPIGALPIDRLSGREFLAAGAADYDWLMVEKWTWNECCQTYQNHTPLRILSCCGKKMCLHMFAMP